MKVFKDLTIKEKKALKKSVDNAFDEQITGSGFQGRGAIFSKSKVNPETILDTPNPLAIKIPKKKVHPLPQPVYDEAYYRNLYNNTTTG
jgi:hypothetical protein